ncbi:DUF2721 domain-containing protein [Leptolyngbya sp. 15MV]|nr:DUF2721 domain-containing protein [Leptolyngbya sp. 15MV]
MLDLLVESPNLASELVARTSSTARVQEIVRLSLAPAFLLAAIGAIMNVMVSRLIWVAGRIEKIELRIEDGKAGREKAELPTLRRRRVLAQRAVMFSTAAAVTISIVIALLFISAFIIPQIGTVTAIAWISTMLFLIIGLAHFLLETHLAARAASERR